MKCKKVAVLLPVVAMLNACISVDEPDYIKESTSEALDTVEEIVDAPDYLVTEAPYVDIMPVYKSSLKYEWLSDIKGVSIKESDNSTGVPLSEVIKQLKSYGINISTGYIPLDRYHYKGFSIAGANALTAIEIICSSMGLDFKVYTGNSVGSSYIEILPMQSAEYTLNIPNRSISFSLEDNNFSGDTDLASILSGGGGESGGTGGGEGGGSGSGSSITNIKNEFWKDLKIELNQLLTRFVPTASNTQSDSKNGGAFSLLTPILVGSVTVNPSTGHITVQAPSTIRKEIIDYLRNVNKKLNTKIEITGKVVIVADNAESKEGLDISAFLEFGKDYGVAMSNDIYNQITLTPPDGLGSTFNAAVDGSFGNAIGVVGNEGLLQVFNAYVDTNSNIKTVYDPRISGTSGSVSNYSRVTPYIFTNYQGSSSTNDNTTTQSIENILIPIDFGITITAYPIYEPRTDSIRTSIELVHVFQASVQTLSQAINGELISTTIPIPDKVKIQTEVIGRNGSLIIVGGQDIEAFEGTLQGIPKLKDSFAGGIFGSSSTKSVKSKYYFVFEARAIDPVLTAL